MSNFLNQLKVPMVLFEAPDEKGGGIEQKENEPKDKEPHVEEKKYSDKELNDILAKQKAKWEKSNEQNNTEDNNEPDVQQKAEKQPQENPYVEKYVQAEVKVAMTQNGIDVTKVNRAVRLVDTKEVLNEEGELDTEKLNTAISELIKEWPELSNKADENGIQKIGSDGNSDKKNEEDLIAQAFGNKK